MKTVVIEGVTYTKVSELARAHQYTTDYLGQLCRSGKINAELVGRAWYANEASLLEHKENRYKATEESVPSTRSSEKTIPSKLKVHSSDRTSHIQVHPRISKKTVKVIETTKQVQAPARRPSSPLFYEHAAPNASLYIPDTTDLLPQTAPKRARFDRDYAPQNPAKGPEVKIAVKPAEAESVKVKTADTPFKLSFSRVPEVSLRGPLAIKDLDTETDDETFLVSETDVRALQPRAIRPKLPGQSRVPLQRAETPASEPTEDTKPLKTSSAIRVPKVSKLRASSNTPAAVVPVQFTPVSVQPQGTGRRAYLVPVVALVAVLFSLVLVGLDTTLVTDGSMVTQGLNFNLASLLSVWQSLRF